MKLKALKYMRYEGKPVNIGDVFEAKAADVRILLALQRAEVHKEQRPAAALFSPPAIPVYVPEKVEAEPDETENSGYVTKKRGYKRRDMVSER